MKILKNYLYNVLYQLFVIIVPLITMPYIAKILGPNGVGINTFTNSNTQYFILFGSMGVSIYGNRQIAYLRNDTKTVSKVFWEIYLMRFITILISLFFFYIFVLITGRYKYAYIMQSIQILAAAFDISWLFMGFENFRVTVLRNIIVKLISIVLIFVLVKNRTDVIMYIFIISISQLLGNLSMFTYIREYIKLVDFRSLNIWRHLKPSIELFIPQIALQIYLVLNKSMLGFMVSVKAAGFYEYSDKIVRMILAIVTSLSAVMMPRMANTFANGDKVKVKEYLIKSFHFVNFIAFPMMFGLAALSLKLAPFLFTEKFNPVSILLIIESLIVIPIAWASISSQQFLVPLNLNKEYTISVALGALVSVLLNVPFIFLWGEVGAMISTVICEWTVTIYQMSILKRYMDIFDFFIDTWKYLFSGIVMFIIVFYFNCIFKLTIISLILEVVGGICIYLVLLYFLHSKMLMELIYIIKNKF